MPPLNRPSQRLAHLGQNRQDAALAHADAACTAVDAVVLRFWRQLLRAIANHPATRRPLPSEVYAWAVNQFRQMPRALVGTVEARLRALAWWGHRAAAGIAIEAIPAERLAPEVEDLVLAPPSPERVAAVVFAPPAPGELPWWQRIEQQTGLAKPEAVALTVSVGYSLGKTPREIARELQPIVQGVQTSARRIARTEGMRVAHETQMDAWDGLGEMLAGYQIHAQRDQHTRPWHAERDGTIYYRHPKPGQLGLDRMPRPPLESPDPRDRPPRAPRVAHNCRCFLTPVLHTDLPAE